MWNAVNNAFIVRASRPAQLESRDFFSDDDDDDDEDAEGQSATIRNVDFLRRFYSHEFSLVFADIEETRCA